MHARALAVPLLLSCRALGRCQLARVLKLNIRGMMLVISSVAWGCGSDSPESSADLRMIAGDHGDPETLVRQGQNIFRYETFNDEAFWTDELQMHVVIAETISPKLALSLGLKVDSDALPYGILEQVDLDDPATTVALLELDAVVGLNGKVEQGELVSVGVTCALCHSTVDDSVAPGIGKRLDGYANRDLMPGTILAASPAFSEAQKDVLQSWPRGFYDPRWNLDGISHPVVLPPAYGLRGVPLSTYTGDGPITYWNKYVAITQMGGQGVFKDPRIGIEIVRLPDLVHEHLPALLAYQLSLEAPTPPAGSFEPVAAKRGEAIFRGKGQCETCHKGKTFTDAGETLHAPEETDVEPLTAMRSATKLYRTTPLRALQQHPPYFHDGSQATLADVVEHYDAALELELDPEEKQDLVEYLKSL